MALKLEQSAKAVEAQEKAEALPIPMRPLLWRYKLQSNQGCCRTEEAARQEVEKKRTAEQRFNVVACNPCTKAQGRNPRRCEEIPSLLKHSRQFLLGGTRNESSVIRHKFMDVTSEDSFLSRSMMIKAKNINLDQSCRSTSFVT